MKAKTFTVAEAKRDLSKLIRYAERGDDVYITLDGKPIVKFVPLAAAKERIPGGFDGKISWRPDAFDALTDEELKDLGFE
ncbi:MAG TPA: type II toxin-antitoxin system prevent-host-death family antitoxin [Terriglobales bacterium]|jgi:prevent-host-death family protein